MTEEDREFHLLEHDDGSWWHEYAPHPHSEKPAYLNSSGAGFTITGKEKVLQKVFVEWFDKLDWSMTSLCQPNSDAGWLDREGRFHGCDPMAHDTYAHYMLKKRVEELENTGWVRVYGKSDPDITWALGWRDGLRLSAEQKMWLDRNGHVVEEWD